MDDVVCFCDVHNGVKDADALPGAPLGNHEEENSCNENFNTSIDQDDSAPLSKNAKKKLLKQKLYEESKKVWKQKDKEKRKNKSEQKKKEWEEYLNSLPEDEREIAKQKKFDSFQLSRAEGAIRQERLKNALQNGQNFVIDLEFGNIMRPEELKSLMQQVMYSYSANCKTKVPIRLTLSGCKDLVLKQMQKVSGFANWQLHREENSYLEIFPNEKSDFVYLTADSPNIVQTFDIKKIYIIGGIVDRNRFKNVTLNKAQEQGIETARLPIDEYVKLASSKVLTVNQVFDIILTFLDKQNWQTAFESVIPLRKRVFDVKESCNNDENGAENIKNDEGI